MSDTALLVIDMFNAYRHPDAGKLVVSVADMVEPLSALVARAQHRDDVDLIYVNDNYGDFTADQHAIIGAALDGARPDLVKPLVPSSGVVQYATTGRAESSSSPLSPVSSSSGARRTELGILSGRAS